MDIDSNDDESKVDELVEYFNSLNIYPETIN